MAYQVLARKWRPQTFAEVLGQEHISTTLQNAIARERVGHAYLFVGPRGIGKTTSARIFAKALNCEAPVTDAAGRIEPCCRCGTCAEITAGSCLDVIEIDGASHNGVDDIRDLRETVQYSPTNGRKYKVFIIDEVHMLSTAAWNALLKTLEEPPAHVKFLFATTEAHKVLPTILSRCQRFDLKRIETSTISGRLHHIAQSEGVHISDDAIQVIARAADGGMRDAQSIFDQMIAFCGGLSADEPISEADVIDVFGLASRDELNALVRGLLRNDPGGMVEAVHHLADRGRNLERLYADLLQILRDLMVYQVVRDPGRILDLSESEAREMAMLAGAVQPAVVQRLVEGLLSGDAGIRHTLNKRVYMETQLMRSMREAHALTLDDVITRLRKLRDGGKLDDLNQLAPDPADAIPPGQIPAAPPPKAPHVSKATLPAPAPRNAPVAEPKAQAAAVAQEAKEAIAPPKPAAAPKTVAAPKAAPEREADVDTDADAADAAPAAEADGELPPDRLLRQRDRGDALALSAERPVADAAGIDPSAVLGDAMAPARAAQPATAGATGTLPPAAGRVPGDFHGPPRQPMAVPGGDQTLAFATDVDDDPPLPEPPGDLHAMDDEPNHDYHAARSAAPTPRQDGIQKAASTAVWQRLEANPVVDELMKLFAGKLVDVRGREAAH